MRYQHNWHIPIRLIHKIGRGTRNLILGKPAETNYQQQLLHKKGKKELLKFFSNEKLKIYNFVSKDKINKLIEKFYKNPKENQLILTRLLTLAEWSEIYL